MTIQTFDVIVVGAGSGGLTSAVGFANVGKKVLLVEREHLGGECTNSGCIPSKALLHHAKTYAAAIAITGTTTQSNVYRNQAFSYVREKITEVLAEETPAHFAKLGITVVMGEAVFTGKRSITIGNSHYTFKRAIIATGSSPRMISVPGLDTSDILTNQNLFTLNTIPKRTLIIGGGPIGLEMGQALSYLGSQVTIADTSNRFAKFEDEAVAKIIERTFLDQGITLLANATIESCSQKTATFTISSQDTEITAANVSYDKVLIAIGRVPNLPPGLEIAAIKYDNAGITVDSKYRTSNKRIYALGDVADKFKFTHQADDVARAVVTRIVSQGLLRSKPKAIPKVTYTQPEIAQVGLSWEAAVSEYGPQGLHRIEVPLTTNDRARTDDFTSGILVVIVRRLSGHILGAHLAGPAAGELIALFTLAIDNKLSLWRLRRTIYAYPTYARLIQKAGDYFLAAQLASLKFDLIHAAKTILPKVVLLGLWVVGLVTLYQYQATTGNTLSESTLALFIFFTTTTFGPLLYILAYTVRPLTFFPSAALTVLSGVFFGFWWGIVYTIIAANLSATLAYFIGRYFGSNLKLESSFFGRYVAACRQSPFMTILTTRLLFLPFDGVNYAAGIIKIPYLPYIVATIIGTLLGIATFVSIGAALSIEEFSKNGISSGAIDGTFFIISAAIFVGSLVLSKILKRSY